MCTLIVAYRVWSEAPVLVAANRDERLDRPAEGPTRREWALPSLAPVDLKAGGTWLGLNAEGLFVGITNRFGRGPDPMRHSRGELVQRALSHRDAREASRTIASLDPQSYNPFHLLMVDRHHISIVWGDGERLHRHEPGPGLHHLTERSFGAAPSGREDFLHRRLQLMAVGPQPSLESFLPILGLHDDGSTGGFDGVCVHTDRGYGTRSSTLVKLGTQPTDVRFLHTDGPPCTSELVDDSVAAQTLLAHGSTHEGERV